MEKDCAFAGPDSVAGAVAHEDIESHWWLLRPNGLHNGATGWSQGPAVEVAAPQDRATPPPKNISAGETKESLGSSVPAGDAPFPVHG